MNEPLFTQIGTDLHPRRRFWTGLPPAVPDKADRTSPHAFGPRAFALATASFVILLGRRGRPEPAG